MKRDEGKRGKERERTLRETIIIPTYNEAENIEELVERVRRAVGKVEIAVVDDSPNSLTADVAREAGCKVVQRGHKLGLSSAVIEGLRGIDGDKVIVMDADLQHPPEALPLLIKALDTHDLVIMSRYVAGGGVDGWSRKRRVLSRTANLLAKPLTRVKDPMSGFFGFRRAGLREVDKMRGGGFKILLELLMRGKWESVVEVPYTFCPRVRGKTKMRFEQVREYLIQLVRLYFYKFRFLRFGIVGGLGVPTSLLILWFFTSFVHLHYLVSALFAFTAAASQNYWLNRAWTFSGRDEASTGYLRYILAAGVTYLGLDIGLLFVFTQYVGLYYLLSAVVAIGISFIIRYFWVSRWIWRRRDKSEEQ